MDRSVTGDGVRLVTVGCDGRLSYRGDGPGIAANCLTGRRVGFVQSAAGQVF
jgi:hypothetical protein